MSFNFLNTRLGKYAERLAQLQGQEPRIFQIVLNTSEIKELIVRLNTEDQLGKEHVDSLDKPLFSIVNKRGVYSKFTEELTQGLKRAGEQYNLNLTGEFWDSFRVEVRQNEIKITANPIKEDTNLLEEYGRDILGLTAKNKELLRNEAKRLFIDWYKKNLLVF